MTALSVHMGGRLVGTLDAADRRSLRFTYAPAYAADAASTPLSVSMALRVSPYSHATIHPYLWGLLPDNDRVIERWAREFGCSATDVTGLLLGVGGDVAGAAQYVAPDATPEESVPKGVEWLHDDDVAQFLRELRRDTTTWRPHSEGRWSLAGAQAKIALLYDRVADRWGIPSGETPTTHIVKPAISGLDDLDINEHLCLTAARRSGLLAAATSIRTFGGERALVVERYDRIVEDSGAVVRVHQEDLCQALSVHPDRKYEVDGGPSAEQIGRLIREVAGDRDAVRFFDALAYNWLVLATDGHAKNYSLLLSDHQVRLAPLYDVASALPHLDHPRKARMAQKIGDEYRPSFIQRRHWERLARPLGLSPDEACARISALAERLPDALADAAYESNLTVDEQRIADAIRDQITRWAAERVHELT
ncbi:MAG: type II toxin-antitoxin system HipA family toxin [Ilumatobacteraceae bacterium]